MRKPPEALNDIVMGERITLHVAGFNERRQRCRELAAFQLVRQRLAVLKRQISEEPLNRQQRAIEFPRNGMTRSSQGKRIRSERARSAAKNMARKLVEHDDVRQALCPTLQPVLVPAAGEPFDKGQKKLAYARIQCGILFEPALQSRTVFGWLAEPETQYRPRLGFLGFARR